MLLAIQSQIETKLEPSITELPNLDFTTTSYDLEVENTQDRESKLLLQNFIAHQNVLQNQDPNLIQWDTILLLGGNQQPRFFSKNDLIENTASRKINLQKRQVIYQTNRFYSSLYDSEADDLYLCGGVPSGAEIALQQCFYNNGKNWSRFALPKRLAGAVMSKIQGKIILTGGIGRFKPVANINTQIFELVRGSQVSVKNSEKSEVKKFIPLDKKSQMKNARLWHDCVNFQDKLICGGGVQTTSSVVSVNEKLRWTCLKDVEMFDPVLETWSAFPSLNHCRSQFKFLNLDGHLYAIGGQNAVSYGTGIHKTIEVYKILDENQPFKGALEKALKNREP